MVACYDNVPVCVGTGLDIEKSDILWYRERYRLYIDKAFLGKRLIIAISRNGEGFQ